jgi:hypothetical protein
MSTYTVSFESFDFAVEGRCVLGCTPLIMMLPERAEHKMLLNEAFLPPHVIADSSSSLISERGFMGLLNSKDCEKLVRNKHNAR